MADILEEIIAWKHQELTEFQQVLPTRQLLGMVEPMLSVAQPSMKDALCKSETGIIAEFKRKSPLKGWIRREGRADVVPKSYQAHGAAALSILTDSKYFGGYDEFIQQARATGVSLPILYKNFVIDPYQLLMARHSGASAVLLIAASVSKPQCKDLLHKAHELGLEVLLEMHSEADLDFLDLSPDMYGINNRNLGTFVTDVNNSLRLAERLPAEGCKVSESGLSRPETVKRLRTIGFKGFLMGEHFMRQDNPGEALQEFISHLK